MPVDNKEFVTFEQKANAAERKQSCDLEYQKINE